MAKYFVNTTVTQSADNTPVYQLGSGDDLFVAAIGSLVALGASSEGLYVNGYANNSQVTIAGSVYSANGEGIYSLGDYVSLNVGGQVYAKYTAVSVAGAGSVLTVGPGGYLSGDEGVAVGGQYVNVINNGTITGDGNDAFQIGGQGARIVNAGVISSRFDAFFIDAIDTSIVNTGTIDGGISVHYLENSKHIYLDNSGTFLGDMAFTVDTDFVTNSGTIQGGSMNFKAGDDIVTNSGEMTANIFLGDGNDTLDTSNGKIAGAVFGEGGNDTLTGGAYADQLNGGDGDDSMYGHAGDDQLSGGKGNDTLIGNQGDDSLSGDENSDLLKGGQGDDTLRGGAGADSEYGGAGVDTFVYTAYQDSAGANQDRIYDLENSDSIDLSAIDADKNTVGNQAFHLVASFSNHTGELLLAWNPAQNLTLLEGDVNGDGNADLIVQLIGQHNTFSNFML